MVRPLRRLVENGWYHVFGRGWERRAIFTDQRDRAHFLELLDGLCERYRFQIHAYTLMSNHHHLIVQTPDANLSQGMQWFNTSYAAWFNARHDRVGSLWQGRYRDVPIENGTWAYDLSCYVHLNPLRIAGLGLDKRGRALEASGFRTPTREQVTDRLKRLRSYRWSSYRAYAGYCTAPPWLTTDVLLKRAHQERSRRRAAYRAMIRQRLAYGGDPTRAERLRDVIAIGGVGFARSVRESVAGQDDDLEHKMALRRRATVDEVRSALVTMRGEPWEAFAHRRSDPGRALFLWAVRRRCGVTLRAAGEVAGGMKPAAVDIAIRRLEQRAKQDPELAEAQQRLLLRIDADC